MLATELFEGATYQEQLSTRDCEAALAGLQLLHDHGVPHRDIHSGNIFVAEVSLSSAFDRLCPQMESIILSDESCCHEVTKHRIQAWQEAIIIAMDWLRLRRKQS